MTHLGAREVNDPKYRIEWWVLCSAYFTIKYRYKKCQSLFLSDFFCYIHEINIALLFVDVYYVYPFVVEIEE